MGGCGLLWCVGCVAWFWAVCGGQLGHGAGGGLNWADLWAFLPCFGPRWASDAIWMAAEGRSVGQVWAASVGVEKSRLRDRNRKRTVTPATRRDSLRNIPFLCDTDLAYSSGSMLKSRNCESLISVSCVDFSSGL